MAQVGAAERAAEQVGADQPGPNHPRAVEQRAGEVGVRQFTLVQVEVAQVRETQGNPLAAGFSGDKALMPLQHDVEFRLAEPPAGSLFNRHRRPVSKKKPDEPDPSVQA